MKTILLSMALSLSLLCDTTIRWYGDFDEALKASQSSRKPLFVVAVERGCSECRELFATTLMRKSVVAIVNSKTVPVIVTKESENYPIELLYTLSYPAIFLLSPDEVLLKGPITGAVEAALLEKELFNEL
ncbi:MAG: thioredoxin family protein [Hydrogenimonas sp.]|nr:thioredoxin family protein [Hydrogenimonas sp.]